MNKTNREDQGMHRWTNVWNFVILVTVFSALLSSCDGRDVRLDGVEAVDLYTLKESRWPIGQINSFDLDESGLLAASTKDGVYLFDSSGEQTGYIEKKGRGRGEYTDVKYVRLSGDKVYIWCTNLMKFLVYDLAGNFMHEYSYKSAIADFQPDGDRIYIYTAGLRAEKVIDILDIAKGEIVGSVVPASVAHQMLTSAFIATPMLVQDGGLYFMTKDKLDVYYLAPKKDTETKVLTIPSETFQVSPARENLFQKSIREGLDYITKNSYTVALGESNGVFPVLTIEGREKVGELSEDGRGRIIDGAKSYFCLYRVNKRGVFSTAMMPRINTFGFCSVNGVFYGLKLSGEGTDQYQLFMLQETKKGNSQ